MKTTTPAAIIEAATATAEEIRRVMDGNARRMKDAANIAHLAAKQDTQNVDRLFELAANATAAAAAADLINTKWTRDNHAANAMYAKAERSAAAYAAAATRAGYTAESVAKREAAAEAVEVIKSAYDAMISAYGAGNRAYNRAVNDARAAIHAAKIAAAVTKAREILSNYPETTEADAAVIILRELDSRSKDIDAAAADFRRVMLSNDDIAKRTAAAAFAAVTGYTIATGEEPEEPADEHAERRTTDAAARCANLATKAAEAEDADAAAYAAREAAHYARHAAKDAAEAGTKAAAEAVATAAYYAADARDAASKRAAAQAMQDAYEAMQEAKRHENASNPSIVWDTESDAERADRIAALDEGYDEAINRATELYSVAADAREEADSAATAAERERLEAIADAAAEAMEEYLDIARTCTSTADTLRHTPAATRPRVIWESEAEEEPREQYEPVALMAYLGDYAADFDVEAIEAEATEYDPANGNRYWKRGINLEEIAAAHDLTTA